MGLIGSFLKTAITAVTIPVSVGLDVLTLGGDMTDKDESYTEEHLRTMAHSASKLLDEIEDI